MADSPQDPVQAGIDSVKDAATNRKPLKIIIWVFIVCAALATFAGTIKQLFFSPSASQTTTSTSQTQTMSSSPCSVQVGGNNNGPISPCSPTTIIESSTLATYTWENTSTVGPTQVSNGSFRTIFEFVADSPILPTNACFWIASQDVPINQAGPLDEGEAFATVNSTSWIQTTTAYTMYIYRACFGSPIQNQLVSVFSDKPLGQFRVQLQNNQ